MLEFKKPELSDKQWVDSCLKHAASLSCEYTFGNTYIWSEPYNSLICRFKDFFICRWGYDKDVSYSLPLGEGNFSEAINEIIADAKSLGAVPKIYGVTAGYTVMLQEAFTGKFTYKYDGAFSDYIYLTENLANLSGKKYHGKRNHISNFKKANPDWCFEKINADNFADCLEVHKKWLESREEESEDYTDEFNAVKLAFEHYDELGFIGGLIRVNGEAIAYTFGEPQPLGTCFVTHFEKALPDFQGAYAIINQEFAKNCLSSFEYVNREEDLGIEGLRKAKLSYHPSIILEKELAVYND